MVRFGVFEADLQSGDLRKHGLRVRVPGQAFKILAVLLEQPGQVVTREELRKSLWPDDTFVDFEHSLNSAIKKLRAALRDSAENPRYIETLPRLGYRFIAPVEAIDDNGAPGRTTLSAERMPVAAPGQQVAPLRRWLWLAGAALLVIGSAASPGWRLLRAHLHPAARRNVLAVLPFANLTGDSAQDYFSDGLTEEMITQLGRLDPQRLGVIARTSVLRYKNGQTPLERVASELGVDYVLEGSVRRDADKVRITAQLSQTKDQTHIWAREYDRELTSLLVLQGEIAMEVAEEIKLTLGEHKRLEPGRQPALSSESFEAYDLYLKGLYFWNKRSAQGFARAVDYFQQSIAKQPAYARAHAGLADCYALIGSYGFAPPNEIMPKARAAALKALQLDNSLAEAHTSLALVLENHDWDWQTAEKEYRRAIELDPNYATAHHWYAEYLAYQGRFDEALAESERARRLDPLSLIIAVDKGAILYFARQYDRALQQFRAVHDMDATFSRAYLSVNTYAQSGRFTDALAAIDEWRQVEDTPWLWAWKAHVYGRLGQLERAQEALRKMQEVNRRSRVDPEPMLATAFIGMGWKSEALAALEALYQKHSNGLTSLKVDPVYDPLRSEPRFQDLMHRVGLAQ